MTEWEKSWNKCEGDPINYIVSVSVKEKKYKGGNQNKFKLYTPFRCDAADSSVPFQSKEVIKTSREINIKSGNVAIRRLAY